MDEKMRQEIALFRYGLIADLVHRKAGERGLYALLREKAERVYEIPGSRRTRVAVETLRDWLSAYRRVIHRNHDPRSRGVSQNHDPGGCQKHDSGFSET